MTASPLFLHRRAVLRLAATAVVAASRRARAETALAEPMPSDSPTIFVAGPGSSDAATWARLLQSPLSAGLMANATLPLRFVGGRDGVTGANQFDARAMPDGSQALLFPGTVGLAWLAGDSRVRFDAAHLLPLMAAVSPGVVMLRGDLAGRPARKPVRVACPASPSRQATTLLALDLLDVPAVPVAGGADATTAARAGAADAVLVTGSDVAAQLRGLTEAGLTPAFTVGGGLAGAAPAGPPLAPDLLSLLPAARRADPLTAAWSGMAAASVIEVVLGLPRQSPAGAITRWRFACTASLTAPDIVAALARNQVRLLSDSGAASAVDAVRVPPDGVQALQRWLDMRLDWQPS